MRVIEIYQWILSFLSASAVHTGMKLLMTFGDFLPDRIQRVDHSWGVQVVPYYTAPHPQAEVAVHYEDCGRAMVELVELFRSSNLPINHIVEVSWSSFIKHCLILFSENAQGDKYKHSSCLY